MGRLGRFDVEIVEASEHPPLMRGHTVIEPQGKAYFVNSEKWKHGKNSLYRVDPPFKSFHYEHRTFSHVVICELIEKTGPSHDYRTFFIPSDETGAHCGWMQLDHSVMGHDAVASLGSAGYRIVDE